MKSAQPTDKPKEKTTDSFDLHARLRQARIAAGLSQRELARRARITHATISLIELGRVSPSVASLKTILSGIPMTLAEFFAEKRHAAPKWVIRADEFVELGSKDLSLRQVGADLRGRKIQMLHETYPPGADTGAASYSHAGEETGFVISGSIEITVGEEICVLRAGDGYCFSSVTPHRFRNPFRDICVIVSACTLPTF